MPALRTVCNMADAHGPATPEATPTRVRTLTPDERAQLAAVPVPSFRRSPSPAPRATNGASAGSAARHQHQQSVSHTRDDDESGAQDDFVVDSAELISTKVTRGGAKASVNGNGAAKPTRRRRVRAEDSAASGTRAPHPPGSGEATGTPRDVYGRGTKRGAHPTHARRRSPRSGGLHPGEGHTRDQAEDSGGRSGAVKYTPREPGFKSLQPVLTLKQKRDRERARAQAAADAASPQWHVAGFGSPQRRRARGARAQRLPLLYLQQHRSPRRDGPSRPRKHTSRSQERGSKASGKRSGDRAAPHSARAQQRRGYVLSLVTRQHL